MRSPCTSQVQRSTTTSKRSCACNITTACLPACPVRRSGITMCFALRCPLATGNDTPATPKKGCAGGRQARGRAAATKRSRPSASHHDAGIRKYRAFLGLGNDARCGDASHCGRESVEWVGLLGAKVLFWSFISCSNSTTTMLARVRPLARGALKSNTSRSVHCDIGSAVGERPALLLGLGAFLRRTYCRWRRNVQ